VKIPPHPYYLIRLGKLPGQEGNFGRILTEWNRAVYERKRIRNPSGVWARVCVRRAWLGYACDGRAIEG
jgi:hypothetical protein